MIPESRYYNNTYSQWFKIRWSGLQLLVHSSITFTRPNDIESEVSGKIVKILVDDSSPVEFDQPLFLVDPS